jgi:serine/threonine protein kinase
MLYARTPFQGYDDKSTLRHIIDYANAELPIPNSNPYGPISDSCKDLIRKLLTADPKERLGHKGASEIRNHPFFRAINFKEIWKQKAPLVPIIRDSLDFRDSFNTSNFESDADEVRRIMADIEERYKELEADEDVTTDGSLVL